MRQQKTAPSAIKLTKAIDDDPLLPPALTPITTESVTEHGTSGLPHQQLYSAAPDDCSALSLALESGTVLQMDQENLRIKAFYGTSENP